MTAEPIVQTHALTYHFSKQSPTIKDINLRVDRGSIYGFLGPNGAGKTTTLRLLLGLLKKQQGSIHLFGREFNDHRIESLQRIGSLIEQPSLYGHLTAKENLEIYRRIYNAPKERIGAVLDMVALNNTGSKKAKQFSLGMKQRLSIALALLHKPELLILDEPTNGLDPNGIVETRELIKRLNREGGVTIIVSSHILAEVERMATHVGIIHGGALLFQGTLEALQQQRSAQSFLQFDTGNNEAALQLLREAGARLNNGYVVLPYKDRHTTALLNKTLVDNGIDVYAVQPQQTDLEQLFMDITSNHSA